MTAYVHLALLVGAALFAGAVVGRHRSPLAWRRALWCLPALLVPACGATGGLHRCDAGTPLLQWLVPSIGMFAVLLWVDAPKPRWASSAILAALAIVLSFHYAGVVHGPTWVGNVESMTLEEGETAHAEWHTAITGLYRRSGGTVDRLGLSGP